MSIVNINELAQLIMEVAREEILPRFNHVVEQDKADGSVVTEADLETQRRLMQGLTTLAPEIPLLGEEMTPEEQSNLLHGSDYLWCLDPLDGTSNFASGVPFFCTSLALLHHGQAVLSVLYDPVKDECFSAQKGQGAQLNGRVMKLTSDVTELGKAIAVVDLKRLTPELATRVAVEQPFRSQRNFGSGALDWAWLAAGRFQLYLHGGQKLWDYMGGSLILSEAGGIATTLENEDVACQELIPRSVVAATDTHLHQIWLDWTGQA
ncbi:MAG: inositol monophosphatase [Gammaproteobacteria bacterium]|nr:inositol monophosphatase [Gammaproteobacteria bacterium]